MISLYSNIQQNLWVSLKFFKKINKIFNLIYK
jgi:hypothetical protein